jgi:PAS domain S-box-containing protein
MIDGTRQKQVEESLRASEKRYRLLFERNMAGALRTSLDGSVLDVNDAFARILGFGSRDDLQGRKVQDLYYRPADREAMLARLRTERGLSSYEVCLRHQDGSPVWVLSNLVLQEEPPGPAVIHGTIIDITERKRAEEALLLFRTLIDRSNDAIEVIDPKTGRFLDVNQTACLAHGYTRDEYLALSVQDVAPTSDPAAWGRNLEELRRQGSRLHVGLHRRKDGSTFPVEVNITYVRLNRDYIVAVVRDISERKRAEEEIQRTADLLRVVADETTDAVFVKDRSGRYLLFNKAAARFVGKSVAEVLGKDDTGLFDPESARRVMERDRRVMESGQADTVEEELTAAGVTRAYHATKAPFRDGAGNVIGLVGISRDITDRMRAEQALRDSEQRFRTFVDHATDAFLLHDDQGTILDVNQQACDSLGYSRSELIGTTPMDFNPDIDPARLAEVQRRLDAGEVLTLERRHRRKDGSVFPVEIRIRPFWEGGRRFAVALIRDITDRKWAEEALRKSEELLRQAVRVANLGIFDHDHLTDTIYWSPEQRVIYGWVEERTSTLSDFVAMLHPEDRERIIAAIRRAHDPAGDGVFDVEQRIVRPDGEVRWLVTRAQTFFEGEGDARHPVRTVGAVLDVTEWKRVEERLAEAQEIGGFGSFEADVTTWVGHCSPALCRIFGFENDEPFRDIRAFLRRHVHPDDRARADAARAKLLEEGGTDAIEVRYLRPDGQARILQIRRRALRTVTGQVTKLVGTIQDVTELKRLEEQFRQAQKMEAVGQLAGGVAHDFNNLLTVISGLSELAFHRMRHDDPSRALIAEVLKAGERAAGLTRQLLAFSRKQVLRPQVLDVNSLVGELSKLLLRLIGEDIGLRLEAGAALGPVKVDPGQFEQAVINLAVNARDAMPRGGRLTIETRNAELGEGYVEQHPDARPGRYVVVAVSDTGHGMDPATRARIFEPFFTTKAPGRGTGLGLAMVYGFVKQSGGHIEVDSEVGTGTTFKVYLPRTEETAPSGRPPQDLVTIPGGTETILLVEDQDAVRTFARHVLLARGYTVLEARDGEEAFWVAQQRQGLIHLLLTDVVMPRMSGRQLADLLAPDRREMRVLFVSGHAEEAVTRYGVPEAGGAFLQKPFSQVQLARKVREVLDTGTAGRG